MRFWRSILLVGCVLLSAACGNAGPPDSFLILLTYSSTPQTSDSLAVVAEDGEVLMVIPIAKAILLRSTSLYSRYERLPGVLFADQSSTADSDPEASVFVHFVSAPTAADSAFAVQRARQVFVLQSTHTLACVMRLSRVQEFAEYDRVTDVAIRIADNVIVD